jgi:hypothetical protein
MAALRVAVIINTDEPEPMRMMRESYMSIFEKLSPGSATDFFNGVLDLELSVLATNKYDLLVIGGGTYIAPAESPWIQRLVEFEKNLYANHKEQKVVGICLGHQTSALTLGGTMCYLPEPEVRYNLPCGVFVSNNCCCIRHRGLSIRRRPDVDL